MCGLDDEMSAASAGGEEGISRNCEPVKSLASCEPDDDGSF